MSYDKDRPLDCQTNANVGYTAEAVQFVAMRKMEIKDLTALQNNEKCRD